MIPDSTSREAHFGRLMNTPRIWCKRLSGVSVDGTVRLGKGVITRLGVHQGQKGSLSLGPHTWIGDGAILDCWGGAITLHEHVYVGPYTVIYGHGGVTIGEGSLIAMQCAIVSSQHTVPGKDRAIRWEPDQRAAVSIGKDVWLGCGVKVMAGVTIGDGCVVGAGAVVTDNLPPYSFAMGVPAKVVRQRE